MVLEIYIENKLIVTVIFCFDFMYAHQDAYMLNSEGTPSGPDYPPGSEKLIPKLQTLIMLLL